MKKGISYPEQFMLAYLEVKGIKFEYQKKLKNSRRRFDFYLPKTKQAIEVHGLQHYEESNLFSHKETVKSDQEKRKYCKKHNITLIELDARKSKFNFIENSIKECHFLPNIEKEDEDKILESITKNSEYDAELMLQYHNEGMAQFTIAKKLNMPVPTVRMILIKNGVEVEEHKARTVLQSSEEICQMYEGGMSIIEISEHFGLNEGSLLIDKILKDNYVELRYGGRYS